MSQSSSPDAKTVDRFLRAQRFRDAGTRRVHGNILSSFQYFVSEHSTGSPLSVSIVQRWLKERREKWPLHMIYLRARLVERFLEWSQAHGVISSPTVITGRARRRLFVRCSVKMLRQRYGNCVFFHGSAAS